MDHDDLVYLRGNSAAWRLLRADTAPLILAVLGDVFVTGNARTIAAADLIAAVDDQLTAINDAATQSGRPTPYGQSAKAYVDTWAGPNGRWLRAFYPDGSDEAHYDATSDFEKAYLWVTGLQTRSFVGTESRLHTLVELLRQMVHGADTDPQARLARLHQRRQELDAEIERAEQGLTEPLDTVALLDRYQHFSSTARELLSDFREVEENFRALDRQARAKIAGWDGGKGELLDELVGDRHAIAASDQGRSFQSFYDFLLSRRRQEELGELLESLVQLDQVPVERRMRHLHHDWLDAAERTQHMVRLLSEQLRRFLDDQVWLENRRVMDLVRSIERTALQVRDDPPKGTFAELDAVAPRVRLPLERPLYAPTTQAELDSEIVPEVEEPDVSSLFEQVYVDSARLSATVRDTLRGRDQVRLAELLTEHPPQLGLAEIVGYLALDEEDFELVTDDAWHDEVPYVDAAGRERAVRMPQVTIVRGRHHTPNRHHTPDHPLDRARAGGAP